MIRIRIALITTALLLGLGMGAAIRDAEAARNSSGTYVLPAGNPVVTHTPVSSTWANTTLSDIAQELTDSLDRSGKGAMLAPLQCVGGSASLPAINFPNAPTSGFYSSTTNVVCVAVLGQPFECWGSGGNNNVDLINANVQINGDAGVSGSLAVAGDAGIAGNLEVNGLTGLGGRAPAAYELELADSTVANEPTVEQLGASVPVYIGTSDGGAGGLDSIGFNLHVVSPATIKFGGTGFGAIMAFNPASGGFTYSTSTASGTAGGSATTQTVLTASSTAFGASVPATFIPTIPGVPITATQTGGSGAAAIAITQGDLSIATASPSIVNHVGMAASGNLVIANNTGAPFPSPACATGTFASSTTATANIGTNFHFCQAQDVTALNLLRCSYSTPNATITSGSSTSDTYTVCFW